MMTPANTVAALTLLLLTQSLCVSTGFICPNLGYLDSFVQLICTGGSISHKYTNPRGVDVTKCPLVKDMPCTPANVSASVISSTQTVFNVTAVTTTDAGTWSCDSGINIVETCNLTVAKTPACSITSKEDTDVLVQYQQLTLTVDIQDYYCSTALTFSLQTGNVTTLLMEADSVASVTHNTPSVTLNVTDSHLGAVGLMFCCDNSQWKLTCNGVTDLVPKTPTCNIISDKDTETLTLYEEVTLTVDIAAFYDIQETKTISTQGSDGQDPQITVAGAVSAIVFLNIIVITIVIVVKRHQMTRSADTHTHDDSAVTVDQSKGSASGNDEQGPGLRINPVYVPTTISDRIVTTGTGVMGGDNLQPETRGEYVGLDRTAVQPSNIYEQLRTYEQISNM